jgi:hypothetical protein
LKNELPYEGTNLPLEPSKADPAPGRVRQLPDPAIYREAAKTYLLSILLPAKAHPRRELNPAIPVVSVRH